jgi:hypothetical protein
LNQQVYGYISLPKINNQGLTIVSLVASIARSSITCFLDFMFFCISCFLDCMFVGSHFSSIAFVLDFIFLGFHVSWNSCFLVFRLLDFTFPGLHVSSITCFWDSMFLGFHVSWVSCFLDFMFLGFVCLHVTSQQPRGPWRPAFGAFESTPPRPP